MHVAEFIGNVIGETTGIYATDISFTFNGVIPISSKCETNEDGISKIDVPLLRYNDMSTFAFTQKDSTVPISIMAQYTVDGQRYTLCTKPDLENLLGLQLSKNFPIKRFLDRECNTIRSRAELTNKTKQEMLQNILKDTSEEQLGSFYSEFKTGLEHLIESFELISTRNRNVRNNIAQSQNRSCSVGRQVSASVSRLVSESSSTHHEIIEEEEENDET
jgi:hypothetical protein